MHASTKICAHEKSCAHAQKECACAHKTSEFAPNAMRSERLVHTHTRSTTLSRKSEFSLTKSKWSRIRNPVRLHKNTVCTSRKNASKRFRTARSKPFHRKSSPLRRRHDAPNVCPHSQTDMRVHLRALCTQYTTHKHGNSETQTRTFSYNKVLWICIKKTRLSRQHHAQPREIYALEQRQAYCRSTDHHTPVTIKISREFTWKTVCCP